MLALVGRAGCATAPRLVGPVRPAIRASQVMVFILPLVPRHYVVVARLDPVGLAVHGCVRAPWTNHFLLERDIREAARLGANGLLLVPYKEKPGIREQGTSCGAFERVKHALAIFVPPG